MKNTKQLFIATALFLTGLMNAQVGIGTINPAASAELEVSSTTKGFLPPRMSNSQMINITTPALGLTVYCTDCAPAGLYTNQASDAAAWQHISGAYGTLDATGNNAVTLQSFYNGWTTADAGVTYTYSGTATTVTHTSGQKFSENATCTGKLISRSSNPTSCPANVYGATNIAYPTVYINGQCWMKTNLKEIPSNYSTVNSTPWINSATSSSDLGYWGYFNSDDLTGASGFKSSETVANEGYMYQWKAAMNGSTNERAQGACPTGWHVPSDCEYMYLEHGLGMSLAYQEGTRNAATLNQGDTSTKLKSTGGGITANNFSGFSAILTGKRTDFGVFSSTRSDFNLWTSTTIGNPVMRFSLNSHVNLQRVSSLKNSNAMYVRCLKN